MFAVGLKNVILMILIVLILHFLIKNASLERKARSPPTYSSSAPASLPPKAAASRPPKASLPPRPRPMFTESSDEDLRRFVFAEDDCAVVVDNVGGGTGCTSGSGCASGCGCGLECGCKTVCAKKCDDEACEVACMAECTGANASASALSAAGKAIEHVVPKAAPSGTSIKMHSVDNNPVKDLLIIQEYKGESVLNGGALLGGLACYDAYDSPYQCL